MATKQEFDAAFTRAVERGENNIFVRSKSGKVYFMHVDNLQYVPDGLIYGVPVKPHPRATRDIFWLHPENVEIVD